MSSSSLVAFICIHVVASVIRGVKNHLSVFLFLYHVFRTWKGIHLQKLIPNTREKDEMNCRFTMISVNCISLCAFGEWERPWKPSRKSRQINSLWGWRWVMLEQAGEPFLEAEVDVPVARGVTKQFLFKEGTNWGGLGKEQKRHIYDGPFIACQSCRCTFIEHHCYFPSILSCVLPTTTVKKLATVLLLCCFSVCFSVYFFSLGLRSMKASPISLEHVFLFLILPVLLNNDSHPAAFTSAIYRVSHYELWTQSLKSVYVPCAWVDGTRTLLGEPLQSCCVESKAHSLESDHISSRLLCTLT